MHVDHTRTQIILLTADGYLIDVVVLSINSDSWTNLFVNVLAEKNIVVENLISI